MTTFVSCPWPNCPTVGKQHRPGSKTLKEHIEFARYSKASPHASVGDLMRKKWDDLGDSISDAQHEEAERIAEAIRKNMSQPIGDGKVVVFDIDGVQADFTTPMRAYSADPSSTEAPSEYNYPGWYKNKEHFMEVHDIVMAKCDAFETIDDTTAEAIETLRDNGFTVISVTARDERWRDGTVKFFQNRGIPFSDKDVIFTGETPKSEIPFDYILDDAPHNIEDAAATGGIFAGVFDNRYNRHVAESEGRVERFHSAMEFAQRVIEMESQRA
jgi:hypothetical protein